MLFCLTCSIILYNMYVPFPFRTLEALTLKLRATTLLYIITNLYLIIFRTVQITGMTTTETTFLKDGLEAINIIGTVIGVLLLVITFINAFGTRKVPETIHFEGRLPAILCGISGFCFICGGVASLFDNITYGKGILFVLSIAAAFACVLYLLSSLFGYRVPKFAPLLLISLWLGEFIFAYFFYTIRPLRVRTVYETIAMVAVIIFFLSLGKAHSGVKLKRNVHLSYPLGLTASSLCFVSVIPEFIALILGFSAKISVSPVSPVSLLGAGLFAAFVSLYCFRPKKKQSEANPDMPLIFDDVISHSVEESPAAGQDATEIETFPSDDDELDFFIPEDTKGF